MYNLSRDRQTNRSHRGIWDPQLLHSLDQLKLRYLPTDEISLLSSELNPVSRQGFIHDRQRH